MIWITLYFSFYGMIFIVPLMLEHIGKSVDSVIFFLLGEPVAIIISLFLIDSKSFGRKNLTFIGMLVGAFCYFIGYLVDRNATIFVLFLCIVFTKLPFISVNPLSIELYQTHYRTMAVGFLYCIGRVGSIIMPTITLSLFEANTYLPYIGFGISMLLGSLFAYLVPYDTNDRELDLPPGEVSSVKHGLEQIKEKNEELEVLK